MLTKEKLNELIEDHQFEVLSDNQTVVCVIKLHTGFRLVGTAPGPINPDDWKFETGCNIAYNKAFDQLWQLEAYRITAEANKPLLAADQLANLPAGSAVVQILNIKLEDGSAAVEMQGVLVGGTDYDPKNPAHRMLAVIHNNREQIIQQALSGTGVAAGAQDTYVKANWPENVKALKELGNIDSGGLDD